jgi:hypothetical protein
VAVRRASAATLTTAITPPDEGKQRRARQTRSQKGAGLACSAFVTARLTALLHSPAHIRASHPHRATQRVEVRTWLPLRPFVNNTELRSRTQRQHALPRHYAEKCSG